MIVIGSRKSKLAMWQTETVARALNEAGMATEICAMETKGDTILDTSIAKIGSKGVFTQELEEQLASGATDIAVHSAKDMQSQLPDGFSLIAFTCREKVNDVLISEHTSLDIEDSSKTIRIGTSSVRRRALLRHYYPHIEPVEMRGNLQTRIRKMREGACDALMLAYAGVTRMEYDDLIVKIFPEDQFVPPVGQGCIAIEASSALSEEKKIFIRNCLNDRGSETCLMAERAFLRTLEGGCSIPVFALAILDGGDVIVDGGIVSLDGRQIVRLTQRGPAGDAVRIGAELGSKVLEAGGRALLRQIKEQQRHN
jgi:hydroxymethylbilane synthase